MAIRFLQVTDSASDAPRVADVQRIFRGYYGSVHGDYADSIPTLLSRQAELGHKTILLAAENGRGGAIAGLGLPTLAVQEGGYDTRVLGRNAAYLLRGLQHGIYERRLSPRVV